MKNLLLIVAFILSINVSAQITLNNPAPNTISLNENNVLFNLDYLNFYIKTDDYKTEPFKVKTLKQEYATVLLGDSNLKPYEKSVPLYTIKIIGTYKSNGLKNVYFNFKFTKLEAFLATISLLENYDRKGKLILSRAPADNPDAVNSAVVQITNPTLPGNQSPPPVFPIKNDIVEYIHK